MLARNLMAALAWHFVDLNLSALFLPSKHYKTVQMTHSFRHYPVVSAADSKKAVISHHYFFSQYHLSAAFQAISFIKSSSFKYMSTRVNFHKQPYQILHECPRIYSTLTINFYSLTNLIFPNHFL